MNQCRYCFRNSSIDLWPQQEVDHFNRLFNAAVPCISRMALIDPGSMLAQKIIGDLSAAAGFEQLAPGVDPGYACPKMPLWVSTADRHYPAQQYPVLSP